MNDTRGSETLDPNKQRHTFQDRALILFYALIVAIAMGGWLWLIAWLVGFLLPGW
jgi:hypothetical protein